jgi:hypothetical protein
MLAAMSWTAKRRGHGMRHEPRALDRAHRSRGIHGNRHARRPLTGDGLVETATVEEVLDAVEAFDLQAPWDDVAPFLRLVLPRRRPLPRMTGPLATRTYPPGIRVGLALDVGPAMLFVGDEQLAGWGVTADSAFVRAEADLRARVASRRQFGLIQEPIAGVPTISFQSREGWASCLVLMPDELCRVLGERTGLILAPMRDVIMWMPLTAEPALAEWTLEEFAQADMNALDLPVLTLVDGRLTMAPAVQAPPATASTRWRAN